MSCATAPEKKGIERLSSIFVIVVSAIVATSAIAIDIGILFRINIAINRSTTNCAITPSQALSFNPFIQCFPKAIPNIAAAMSPKVVINNAVIAMFLSNKANDIMAPVMK